VPLNVVTGTVRARETQEMAIRRISKRELSFNISSSENPISGANQFSQYLTLVGPTLSKYKVAKTFGRRCFLQPISV
jgi:hypothetical protein